MSSNNNNKTDNNVQRWFENHGLPFTNRIAKMLDDEGVQFVEQLKILGSSKFDELFANEKNIIKTQAQLAFKELGGKKSFDFANIATSIPLDTPTAPPSKKPKTSSNSKNSIRHNGHRSVLDCGSSFTRKVIKTKEEKQRERMERQQKAEEKNTAVINIVDGTNDVAAMPSGSREPSNITNGVNNNESSTSTPTLLLGDADYRAERCFLASTLNDPAGVSEKTCWEAHMDLLPADKRCADLEDPKGYYKLLGCNKKSSTKDIDKAYHEQSKLFKEVARTNHPDKTNDKDKISEYQAANAKYEEVKEAYQVIGTSNEDGSAYPDRVNYDRTGEVLRDLFKQKLSEAYGTDETYDSRAHTINDEKKRSEIYAKGHATRKVNNNEKREGLGSLKRVGKAWIMDGQQDNNFRVQVYYALKNGHDKAEIARHIRLARYSTIKEVSDFC